MTSIWTDDSSPEDRREAALNRLMELCPQAYRMAFKPMVAMAIANAPDEHIVALSADIDRVRALAEAGDVDGVAAIARKYGATDAQVNAYLPMFASMSQ
jgi:hypothetical protein